METGSSLLCSQDHSWDPILSQMNPIHVITYSFSKKINLMQG